MGMFQRMGWGSIVIAIVIGCAIFLTANLFALDDFPFAGWLSEDKSFDELTEQFDVITMKHCYPASNILDDIGSPDPSSDRKSLENYKTIYRLLRTEFDKHPDTIFMIWTLPPLHTMATTSAKAARATEFSEWLKTDFLNEEGPHRNIYVWDFRGIVMDPDTNCLKHEYERDHERGDSHPNELANNVAGPQFAQFIVDSFTDFADGTTSGQKAKIIFLHHSTGSNVYKYTDLGVPNWVDNYNDENNTNFNIEEKSYPTGGNMPVDYYLKWLAN